MTREERYATLEEVDTHTRRRAQEEFEGALIVEAGAGTGKTSILVSRIVVWALGEGWRRAESRAEAPVEEGRAPGSDTADALIEARADFDDLAADVMGRIAAITFTEAAAAEMAERTGSLLSEIAAGDLPRSIFEDRLPQREDQRRPRARALIGALDRLQVRTIHAFCRGLLAQYPLEAGVHPAFVVDADSLVQAEVVREIVEGAIATAYGDPGDEDFLELAVEGFGPAEIEAALLILVSNRSPVDLFDSDPMTSDAIATLIEQLDGAATLLLAEEGGRFANASRVDGALVLCEAVRATQSEVREQPIANVEALESFVEFLRDLWAGTHRKRLSDWRKGKFTKSELTALDGEEAELTRCAGALANLVDHIVSLAPMRLARARRALAPLLRQAREELRRRGAATFESLLRDARDLLVKRPDACSRLRNELDQLLVDEFQDTDPLQCEIVRAIALDGPPEQRPGLFLVGDPKQSIYGWRNADLRAYDEFIEGVLGADGEPGRLSRNFRSLPGVLDSVEDAIAPVMVREPGLQPDFQPLVSARAESEEDEGRVEHWVTWDWDAGTGEPERPLAARAASLEAAAVARDIGKRHAAGELGWREVGILFRSLGDLEIYLQAFRAAGIPYAVERDRSYYRRREIIEASALVRCVLDRNDQVALLAWLRSASVGVPDAALLPLWQNGFPRLVADLDAPDSPAQEALEAAVADAVAAVPADIPGIERIEGWDASLRHALCCLAELRSSFEEDVADRFVSKLRSLSLLEATESARFLGEYRVANLDRFFRDLRDELESDCDRETLLRRLRSGVADGVEVEEARPKGAEDAVRVMTIHKAKGLDFTHTYLVQLHKRGGARGAATAAATVGEVEGRSEYQLFGAATLNFHTFAAQRARVAEVERVRTLYVAMTRARDRLVLVGNWPLEPKEMEVSAAETHIDLLGFRRSGIPDLAGMMSAAAVSGSGHSSESWIFPTLGIEGEESPAEGGPAFDLPSAEDLRRSVAAEHRRREAAALRASRRWNATPSADSHAGQVEERAGRGFDEEGMRLESDAEAVGRSAARVAGTVVHRILEEFDLSVDVAAELQRQRERVADLVVALAGEKDRDEAALRARAILDRLGAGSLLDRLRAIGDHVVARELPVVLPPSSADDGAVAFTAGSIDLCYRDPETDEWVIADYKTDRIEADGDVASRVERYTEQGRTYSQALRGALKLDANPRFELWFLDADRVEVVA